MPRMRNKIAIGDRVYTVKFVEQPMLDGCPHDEVIDHELEVVFIKQGFCKKLERELLMHALFHRIMDETGHDGEDDETIEGYAVQLCNAFGRNPKFWQEFFENYT